MHNLLLGTAKHMLTVWKAQGVFLDKHFASIQDTVDMFVTPSDVGRIPTKISSGFSGSLQNSGVTGHYSSHYARLSHIFLNKTINVGCCLLNLVICYVVALLH